MSDPAKPKKIKEFEKKVLQLTEARADYLGNVTAIDRVIKFLFLGLVPKSVTPNQITAFRFVMIPFIVILLIDSHYFSAAVLFLFAAFSDALDGALARTTDRITRWGILADPLADKLLISSLALILISKFLDWRLAAGIVLIEVFTIASAYYRYNGAAVPAKVPAKIKMNLQCFGLIFIFFHILFGGGLWLVAAFWTLCLAIIFALLSLLIYRSV